MRIVVHDYFGHAFPAQLARALAGRGHQVLHLHCSSFVAGKGRLERAGADPSGLEFEAVSLGRPFAKYDVVRRVRDERMTARALAQRVRDFRPDTIVSIAPLVVQRKLQRASRRSGAAFVFWQQDVMSRGARRVLGRRSRLVGAAAENAVAVLERQLLRASDAVIVISEDFVPLLRHWRVDDERISVIENWAPLDELPVLPRDNGWAREQGFGDCLVFLYSGTLGFKHDPRRLLELARWASTNDSIVAVVSEGPGADWLAREGANEPALRLFPYQRYERLPEVLASADVLVALLEPDASAFSVPSKVLTYLCGARPLLVSVPRENLAARVVERSGGGVVVPPKDPEALIAAAGTLHADEGLRAELGGRARSYAETTFDLERIAHRFEQVLRRAKS